MSEPIDPFEELRRLEEIITLLVPPARPVDPYWLDSDGGLSYCWGCAAKARCEELKLSKPPEEPGWELMTSDYHEYDRLGEIYRKFKEGIDGGFSTESDHVEYCESCSVLLAHSLTQYAVDDELDYMKNCPFVAFDADSSYVVSNVFSNMSYRPYDPTSETYLKLMDALNIANQIKKLLLDTTNK